VRPSAPASEIQRQLQKLVRAYILAGLVFMLLPGTFLGVWNLMSLSADRAHHPLSPAWVQAHGHAQIFGWIGTFVIGIGFFSLSKMGEVRAAAITRGWIAWAAWICGVTGCWIAGVYGFAWRWLLPLSALLECCGYLIFFVIVRQHRPKVPATGALPIVRKRPEAWMRVVMGSSIAFFTALVWHFLVALCVAMIGAGPQLPARAERTLLAISAWGFLVLSVWGFNARWLPMLGGFRTVDDRKLLWALRLALTGVAFGAFGWMVVSAAIITAAVFLAAWSLRILQPLAEGKRLHAFPVFVRIAYGWLFAAAGLGLWAALSDQQGGVAGASRHALTVGFVATMVFTVGPRILPAFCGGFTLFSQRLMIASLVLLNAGCWVRVACEIPAYEFHASAAWSLLPVSAVIELTAVAVFAFNLLLSLWRPPVRQIAVRAAAA
jgi:hypothetical protein